MDDMKWRFKAFAEMRSLPVVELKVAESVNRIANASGDGFAANIDNRKGGVRGSVVAAHKGSQRKNARENTLIRNFGLGRF